MQTLMARFRESSVNTRGLFSTFGNHEVDIHLLRTCYFEIIHLGRLLTYSPIMFEDNGSSTTRRNGMFTISACRRIHPGHVRATVRRRMG